MELILVAVQVAVFCCGVSIFLTIRSLLREREAKRRHERWLRDFNMSPESMRAGSELYTQLPERFQCGLYRMEGSTKVFLGSATRIGDWLVACKHSLVDSMEPYTLILQVNGQNPLVAQTVQPILSETRSSQYLGSWHEVGSDIAAARIQNPIPGLAKAEVGPVASATHVRAKSARTVAGKYQQNSSVGMIEDFWDGKAFGMLSYKGSTIGGFSGAVYLFGNRVLGIHAGGGSINYGFAAAWIKAHLDHLDRKLAKPGVVTESPTGVALRRALQRAKFSDVEVSNTGDPDEIQVKVGGRYFIMDAEEFAELRADETYGDYFDSNEEREVKSRRSRRHREVYEDWEPENDPKAQPEPLGKLEYPDFDDLESVSSSGSGNGLSHPALLSQGGDKDIVCPPQPMSETQSSPSVPLDISGLQAAIEKLSARLESMPASGWKPLADMMESFDRKLSRLNQNLAPKTQSSGIVNQCPAKEDGVDGSSSASQPSNGQVRPASEPSKDTPTLEVPWDGMDLHARMYWQWRSSKNRSSVEYGRLRDEFLIGMGLTDAQRAYLVRWTRNRDLALKKKLRQKKRQPMSNSS